MDPAVRGVQTESSLLHHPEPPRKGERRSLMSFERTFERLTVRVNGEHIEIEQPGYSGNGEATISVPVHQKGAV
jgi:hypothetical protein